MPSVIQLPMWATIADFGSAFADQLAAAIHGRRMIFIDGVGAVGKSPIGRDVAALLPDCGLIELDCYLIEDQNAYVPALKIDQVRDRAHELLRDKHHVVIEGWMCMQIAELLGLDRADYALIYVMRWNPVRDCPEEDELFDRDVSEGQIVQRRELASEVLGELRGNPCGPKEGAAEELIRYTKRRSPHVAADVVIRREPSGLPPELQAYDP